MNTKGDCKENAIVLCIIVLLFSSVEKTGMMVIDIIWRCRMRISLLEPIGISKEKLLEYQAQLVKAGHEFCFYETKTTDPQELVARSEGSEIVIIANTPYPEEVVNQLTTVRMIAVAFTGIDHVGVDACKAKDIMICNAAGYSNQAVAELVIGMAIAALRAMPVAEATVRHGGGSANLGGREICGRTVGIIGLGRIGMMCARLFMAFGANVIAYNRSESEEAKAYGIQYKSLEEVLSESDIISVNLPLNASTKGFIDREKIALMNKNTIFINCARGPIVDNVALAQALNEDQLGFACVDVFDMEPPLPEEYPLLHAKNTLLTPHIAYISEEAMLRRAEIVFNNIWNYIDGKPSNVC